MSLALLFTMPLLGHSQESKKTIRENIEWLDVYMPNTNDSTLPRILLIGNSITRGYYPEVAQMLAGKGYVARLTTSKSVGDPALLKEIELIMGYYKFDIVHFNNGLHGFGYTEEDYKKAFPGFVQTIRKNAPGAKLMWATITPMRTKEDAKVFSPLTERIKVRNKIALDYLATQKDISIDSLWEFSIDHPEFWQGGDGTHPVASGFHAIAEKVAAALSTLINDKK
ncbi:hypothetical protein SAMN05216436_11929 [bacterium A37T11]|nr:hypothetical protein SAMN05216436_11929 [bacterium A37T11]